MDSNKIQDLLFGQECYQIIGACYTVHNELGNGFLEPVYQEALSIEMANNKIPFEREKHISIHYKGYILDKKYIADFVCYDKIILELKSVDDLIDEHASQVFNYLKASKMRLGLLINFGKTKLQYKRVIL
ncbi:MAG: GxxExxY protein [Candidatus Cloacimonetes bacterium]|nr:GxxExxY protein [Candidatus Cloacimonadota bacterium]